MGADAAFVTYAGELPRLRSIAFTVWGKPVPKARARKGRGGHFHTPKSTREYEELIATTARKARRTFDVQAFDAGQVQWPLHARYRLECAIYLPNERRMDCDNILKACADAMNGSIYLDDSQVIETATIKRIDRDDPRIDVRVYVLETREGPR